MVDHTRVSRDSEPYRIRFRFRSRISSSLSPRQMLSLRQYIMQEQMSTRNVTVTWRGKKFIMEMNSVASLKDLEHELQKLTDVKADTMRLIVPEASNKSSKFLSPFSEEHSNTRLRLQEISFSKGKFIRMMGVPKD